MGKLKDLTGQRFGRLTVIERAENSKHGCVRWRCKCDCGNEVVVQGGHLASGAIKSCSCLQKEKVAEQGQKNLRDLVGRRFGRLTVIERAENDIHGHAYWRCRCDCGKEKTVASTSLIQGRSNSCGCLNKDMTIKRDKEKVTHGMSKLHIYCVWHTMKQRCLNPNCNGYHNYGGRGIKVCERWLDLQNFYDDVSKLEHFDEKGYSLDRIDNDGDYEPNNVRWADRKTQNRNQRTNVIVEYNGETMTLAEAAERSGISYSALWYRLKHGDTGDKLFRPVGK